jgi:hypothetical protein
MSVRCTREKGRQGAERERRLRSDFTGFGSSELQYWRISVMEFSSLAARSEERRGEKREEDAGLYRRGIEGHLLWWPFPLTEREEEESGEKMVLTYGAHMSVSEEGIGWGTDSVFFLGCGLLPLTGPKGSLGPILFLFLLFPFSFSVF